MLLGLALAACAQAPGAAQAAPASTVAYQADPSDFPNPERGFSQADGQASWAVDKGLTLVHLYFRLDAYRAAPIPQDYLDDVAKIFADARAAGVKVVPRFTYNFPDGEPYGPEDADAPLPQILDHLDQLAPILRDNSDIIAFMEAGFIGAWGEWHHSQNGLETPQAKREVVDKILSILPPTRAVVVRTPHDKMDMLDRAEALRPAEAFSGSEASRIGHHNDCFLASADDWGTYVPGDAQTIRSQKRYLAADNRFVPQGGETCNAAPEAERFIDCGNAVRELAAQHWSQLNSQYHPDVLARWKTQGCYGEISRRLGYRLRLTTVTLETAARAGGMLSGSLTVVNDGFAAPYNPRGLELILRNRDSGATTVVPLADDPRRWGAGETHTVPLRVRLPAGLARGAYDVLLNLPDPAQSLHDRPQYSIRLADLDAWEPSTGYNRLGLRVAVR